MKKCYLDSNLLVYIKNETSIYYKEAVDLISKIVLADVSLFISPLVIDEFLHSFMLELRFKKISDPFLNLRRSFDEVFSLPEINIVNPSTDIEAQKEVIRYMEKYQLRPRDAYHLSIMLYNRIDSFATFDNDFKKVFNDGVIEKA